jgi:hypothetical protein
MMRSHAVGSNAIFLRASRERLRTALPYAPKSDDNEPREVAAPRRSAVPRLSNSFPGRPNRREPNNYAAEGDLGQTDSA